MSLLERLQNRELQWSSQLLTCAFAKETATSLGSYKSYRTTKHDLQIEDTGPENVKLQSNQTPKLQTLSVRHNLLPRMSIGKRSDNLAL